MRFSGLRQRRSIPPVYDDNHNKTTEGTLAKPAVEAVEAVDWRLEGEYPYENPFNVLMSELENRFRYNNKRAINEIRNFAAFPRKTTSRH